MRFIAAAIVLFVLLYVEGMYIAGMKIAYMWKMPILLYIGGYLLVRRGRKANTSIRLSYLYAVKKLFVTGVVQYPLGTVLVFSRHVLMPLVYHYLHVVITRENYLRYYRAVYFFACFIVVSFIPFMLGILRPVSEGYELEQTYGAEGVGLVGVFQTPHSAAIALAMALVVVIAGLSDLRTRTKWTVGIVIAGIGVVALYMTYVRTGWAMFIVGMFCLGRGSIGIGHGLRLLIMWGLILLGGVYMYAHSDVFRMRLTDTRQRQSYENRDWYERLGSGRLLIAQRCISIWMDAGALSYVIGQGQELAMQRMYDRTGHRIYAHNGFVESLVSDGVVGLLLHIGLIWSLYTSLRMQSDRGNAIRRVGMTVLLMYTVYTLLQGGTHYMIEVMLVALVVIAVKAGHPEGNQMKSAGGTRRMGFTARARRGPIPILPRERTTCGDGTSQ